MFSIEATDGLRKLFIPRWRVWGIVFSSTYSLRELFYSSTNHRLRKLWCMEIDFLRLLIVFIHKVCDKISNSNIPDQNKENRQLLAILWDAAKRRGDGKCHFPCSQCRGFKRRIILIAIATKNCREHRHAKGGNEYRPFVGLALDFFYIFFFSKCMYYFNIYYINLYILMYSCIYKGKTSYDILYRGSAFRTSTEGSWSV